MTHGGAVRFDTAFGGCALAWSPQGIARLRLLAGRGAAPGGPSPDEADLPAEIAECVKRLSAYFDGEAVDFDSVRLDEQGVGADDARIYRALRGVKRGRTTTYGELARLAGLEGAARAVGAAMARNPWPIIVPCHRVLASDGGLGGFSAPGGTRAKRRLLALEGAAPNAHAPLLPGLLVDGEG